MKFITKIIIGLALVSLSSHASTLPVFSVGSTNNNGTLSWAVIPANTAYNGTPVIKFIAAGSDLATAKIQFYTITAQAVVTFTNSTTTLFVNSTNGFGSGASDVIIIRRVASDKYEKRILTSNSSATNLVLTVPPSGAVVPNDIVYRCSTTAGELAAVGSILQGVATNTLSASGGAVFCGQAGKPLLLEVNATTAGNISVVSGEYVK